MTAVQPPSPMLAPARASRFDLTGGNWALQATSGPIPVPFRDRLKTPIAATVPGEVHTALLDAGIIPDPFDGENEALLSWIGHCDWQYRTAFHWSASGKDRDDLVVDGIDTAATIYLNGREVARTANQHRSYRFDVRGLLVDGNNELVIDLRSPIEYAEEQEAILGARPKERPLPFNAIRKRASDFGWDWGIDLSTSGIWRPIGIESWSDIRISSVRPLVDVIDGRATMNAHVDVEWARLSGHSHKVTVAVAGSAATTTVTASSTLQTVSLKVEPQDVELWWPRGHGAQPLYDVDVTVGEDSWHSRVGFRTATLDTTPDEIGSPFTLAVNGKPIYIKGANWIPGDALLTRMTPERYRAGVQEAVDTNMNMLRVWGGGLYESDDFYDACDELGILVWQDFLFVCAAYAEEDPLRAEVIAEAREAVTRLSPHPSLALWNGCNENVWFYVEQGWGKDLVNLTWGNGYYRELLPAIVAELDPTRPYSPGSPFSFFDYAHPNDDRHGTMHLWDAWQKVGYDDFANHHPRFASEFGFQGPPAWTTLTEVVHDTPLDPYGRQMLVHQKAENGNLLLEKGLNGHLPQPTSIEQWHWATQLNQARAVRFAIEHFRADFPRNTGEIMWQINDNWPVVSWSMVDYAGIRKPLWYSVKHACADQLLIMRRNGDGQLQAIAHNDSDTPWSSSLTLERRRVDLETPLAQMTIPLAADPRSLCRVAIPDEFAQTTDATREYLVLRDSRVTAHHWFVEDVDLHLQSTAAATIIRTTQTTTGFIIDVTARSLVKDLFFQADRVHPQARPNIGMLTLSAGEHAQILVTTPPGVHISAASVATFPTLCSVGDL